MFYSQQRSGWLGRPFTVLKLRTMAVQPADGSSLWTKPGDQRITAVGQWLRRLRLDELPQLLNVLNGEMSLIDPGLSVRSSNMNWSVIFLVPIASGTGCGRG